MKKKFSLTAIHILCFCLPLSLKVTAQTNYCKNDEQLYSYFAGRVLVKTSAIFLPEFHFLQDQSICQRTQQHISKRAISWTGYALNYLKTKNIPVSLESYLPALSVLNHPYPDFSEATFIATKFKNILPITRELIKKLCIKHLGLNYNETKTEEFNQLLKQLADQDIQDPAIWETEKFVTESFSYDILVRGKIFYEEAALAVHGLKDYCLGNYPPIDINPEISPLLQNNSDFPSFLSKLAPNVQDPELTMLCKKNFISMYNLLSMDFSNSLFYLSSLVEKASQWRDFILPSTWQDPMKKLKDVACHYAAYKAKCQDAIPDNQFSFPFDHLEVALFARAPLEGFEVTSQECELDYQVRSAGIQIPGISVSPNPFVDYIDIKIPYFEKPSSCSLNAGPIVSMDGKKTLKVASITQNLNPNQLRLTFDHVPAGAYEVSLDFSCSRERFVKKIRLIKSAN